MRQELRVRGRIDCPAPEWMNVASWIVVENQAENMKKEVVIVPIPWSGKLDQICSNGYNVSDIDMRDSSEVNAFFQNEYKPYYDLIKEAMFQKCPDDPERYFFQEPSGCSRLYQVLIENFSDDDIPAVVAAMNIVDLTKRESCLHVQLDYEFRSNKMEGMVVYISRSYQCMLYPPDIVPMFSGAFR